MDLKIVLCIVIANTVALPTMAALDAPNDNIYQPLQIKGKLISNNSFNTENLGILPPQEFSDEEFTAIMLDLLPEFSEILRKFGGSVENQLMTEVVSAFFPIVQKAIEAKARSEGRTLSNEEIKTINLSEISIRLSTDVIESINEKDSPTKIISSIMSVVRPIMEANAANNNKHLSIEEKQQINLIENAITFSLEAMRDMERDNSTLGIIASNLHVARYIMEARAKKEGRLLSHEEEASLAQASNAVNLAFRIMTDFQNIGNDDDNVAEMAPIIMRLTRFLFESQAVNQSRLVTLDEEESLRFHENTLSSVLDFVQDIINGDTSVESLESFITATRSLLEEQAISKGRTSLSNEDENNLQQTERALGLALNAIREINNGKTNIGTFDPKDITIDI